MTGLDAEDIADALQGAAISGCRSQTGYYRSNVPLVVSDRTVRRFRMGVCAFLEQLPEDLTIGELRELLGLNATTQTEDDGDDE